MRSPRRHITYANVLSILVIAMSMSATAFAASRVYTGANIKDNTLTTVDFKTSSIERRDVNGLAHSTMRGRKGPTGDTGGKGGNGPQGLVGPTGDRGRSAHSLVRFATFQSAYLRENPDSIPNNAPATDWDAQGYEDYAGANGDYPNFTEFYQSGERQSIPITNSEPTVIALTGLTGVATQGTIRPTSAGIITATATITVLHQHHAQGSNHGNAGVELHGRMRCKLRIADGGANIGDGTPTMGAHEWISSRRRHKAYTITLTGAKRVTGGSAATNYNVGVTCADVDWAGTTQWTLLSSSLQAHAIYTES